MKSCWTDHPRDRPAIGKLHASLGQLLEDTYQAGSESGDHLGPLNGDSANAYEYVEMMPFTDSEM